VGVFENEWWEEAGETTGGDVGDDGELFGPRDGDAHAPAEVGVGGFDDAMADVLPEMGEV
jgi:hypothetical protein